jgi:type I restriction enzyme S subunit
MRTVPLSDLLISSRAGYWGGLPNQEERDVLVIRNGDIKRHAGVLWDQLPVRSMTQQQVERSEVLLDDLLITTSGECGVTAFVGHEPPHQTCASNFVRILRPDPAVAHPRYLFHFTRTERFRAALRPFIRGTTMQNLSTRDALAAVQVPLPSLPEQSRVAMLLDGAVALTENRRRALTGIRELSASIFAEMFGDPILNEREWPAEPLGALCVRVTDGEHKTPRRSETGIPLLSARSVQAGWIDFGATDFIPVDEYEALRRRIQPRRGDVLISCSGTIGRVALVRDEENFAMVRSVALVRPSPVLSPVYLAQLLATRSMNALMNLRANSSAQANLFQNQIKALPCILPPLDVQLEFERRLELTEGLRSSVMRSARFVDELGASLAAHAFAQELPVPRQRNRERPDDG